eukprot:363671-Chlamydomonas_euryale.AAC.1
MNSRRRKKAHSMACMGSVHCYHEVQGLPPVGPARPRHPPILGLACHPRNPHSARTHTTHGTRPLTSRQPCVCVNAK